jgi:hypothetical protein
VQMALGQRNKNQIWVTGLIITVMQMQTTISMRRSIQVWN